MTREEAIEIIKDYDVNGCGYCHQGGDEIEEAFDMAIEALSAEPCEDCISRKEAINAIKRTVSTEQIKALKRLPSIQPKSKTDVLDKIRAEIEALEDGISSYHNDRPWIFKDEVLQIIDKYKADMRGTEKEEKSEYRKKILKSFPESCYLEQGITQVF